MTISLVPEDTRLRRFECTGGETVFAVTFPVFAAGDVQVVRLHAGVTVTLTSPGDYTLSGIGAPGGFTVTLTAPALAGDVVVVVSAQPASRTAQWTDGQALRAAALNAEFARWWIALQQIRRDVTRTVRLPLTDPSAEMDLPGADIRAGKFLGFDGAGAAVAMGAPNAPLGAVARSGDTMTGDLVIHKPAAVLRLNSSTATIRGLRFSTNNLERWAFLAMNDAESGGNTGSTLRLRRFDDAGVLIGDVFNVDRATGRLTFGAGVLPRVPGVDPTDDNDVVRKAYADRSGPGGSTGLIATTSGTTYDITGIPNWANVIEVFFVNTTTAGGVNQRVRLGTSSGFVSSGYRSASGSRNGEVSDTTCLLAVWTSTSPVNGIMRIVRVGGNTWVSSFSGSEGSGIISGGGGSVDIGNTLTQIRVFIAAHAYTGGHIAVRWTA